MFVGTGAPRGKDLDIPGRYDSDANIHIGIDWLESVAFEHIDSIGERVLVIGVGNTAMDCCRTSKRLGGKDVKVMARKTARLLQGVALGARGRRGGARRDPREPLARKASWSRTASSSGMMFDIVEWNGERAGPARSRHDRSDEVFIPCDDVILAIGQDNAFPWIERDIGIEFDEWDMPSWTSRRFMTHARRRLLRRRRGVGPGEHHLGRRARAPGGDLDPQLLPGRVPVDRPPAVRHEPGVARRWASTSGATRTTTTRSTRRLMRTWTWRSASSEHRRSRSSSASTAEQTAREVERCLNCDIQTVFTDEAVHRVRRLHRHLPGRLPDHHARTATRTTCARGCTAPAENLDQASVRVRAICRRPAASWSRTRTCACTAACAPSAARPPPGTCRNSTCSNAPTLDSGPVAVKESARERAVNDFALKIATVNGTGSASANGLLLQGDLPHGDPGRRARTSSRPTSRACRPGTRSGSTGTATRRASDRVDLMVAMNAQTYAQGHRRGRAGRLAALRLHRGRAAELLDRDDITFSACRSRSMCNEHFDGAAHAHPDEEHHLRRRAGGAARHRHGGRHASCCEETFADKQQLIDVQLSRRSSSATTTRRSTSHCPLPDPRRDRWTRPTVTS